MTSRIIRVDQDSAIAWAFTFMERNSLTISEINGYLEVLRGILPENFVLFGVSNAIEFVLERYPNVFALEGDVIHYTPNNESARWFDANIVSINLFKQACETLKIIEETTDEIKTVDNVILNRTN